jgi:Na+-driven multidrug efflux pump
VDSQARASWSAVRLLCGHSIDGHHTGDRNTLPLAIDESASFVAWTTANALPMIPVAANSSSLPEGSYDPQRLRRNVIRTTKLMFILLIAAVIGILLLGDKLLLLYGRGYSEDARELLWLFALPTIPLAVIRVYVTIKRV